MMTAKFCSECGEALNPTRGGLRSVRTHCDRCAPRFRLLRYLKAITLVLLIIIAYGIGRQVTPQRTLSLIGTPIEPVAASEPGAASANNVSSTSGETPASQPTDEIMAVCGAPTQSGRPCRRKVKGGGYCYQHRDKYGQKTSSLNAPR